MKLCSSHSAPSVTTPRRAQGSSQYRGAELRRPTEGAEEHCKGGAEAQCSAPSALTVRAANTLHRGAHPRSPVEGAVQLAHCTNGPGSHRAKHAHAQTSKRPPSVARGATARGWHGALRRPASPPIGGRSLHPPQGRRRLFVPHMLVLTCRHELQCVSRVGVRGLPDMNMPVEPSPCQWTTASSSPLQLLHGSRYMCGACSRRHCCPRRSPLT